MADLLKVKRGYRNGFVGYSGQKNCIKSYEDGSVEYEI